MGYLSNLGNLFLLKFNIQAKTNNIDVQKLNKFPAAKNILSKELQLYVFFFQNFCFFSPKAAVNFSTHPLAMPMSRKESLLRFQDNKGKNWGPRCKAKK